MHTKRFFVDTSDLYYSGLPAEFKYVDYHNEK